MPKLCIPPTVTVNRATITVSPDRAASLCVKALAAVRASRYNTKRTEPLALAVADGEERRGVAKLGFAWEAAHVRVFRGQVSRATWRADRTRRAPTRPDAPRRAPTRPDAPRQ